MRNNWILLGIALVIAILAIGASACGDDDDDNGEEPTSTEAAEEVPTELPDGEASTVIITDGILTDSAGNTLYIFDNDEAGVSNCAEGCVDIWPPLTVEDGLKSDVEGNVATITRDDGAMQVTFNDQPLYYFQNDEAPGDRNGDNLGGVWHIVVASE